MTEGQAEVGSQGVPDVYVDRMQITVSLYGVSITFSLSEPHPKQGVSPKVDDKVRIRMSPQHAKITAMILKQQLKLYEERTSEIPIPREVIEELRLSNQVW